MTTLLTDEDFEKNYEKEVVQAISVENNIYPLSKFEKLYYQANALPGLEYRSEFRELDFDKESSIYVSELINNQINDILYKTRLRKLKESFLRDNITYGTELMTRFEEFGIEEVNNMIKDFLSEDNIEEVKFITKSDLFKDTNVNRTEIFKRYPVKITKEDINKTIELLYGEDLARDILDKTDERMRGKKTRYIRYFNLSGGIVPYLTYLYKELVNVGIDIDSNSVVVLEKDPFVRDSKFDKKRAKFKYYSENQYKYDDAGDLSYLATLIEVFVKLFTEQYRDWAKVVDRNELRINDILLESAKTKPIYTSFGESLFRGADVDRLSFRSRKTSKKRSRKKSCKYGRKKSGGCKKKPGRKRSKKRSRKKSRRKSCKYGRKKSGGCKKKPGRKKSRR